MSAYTLHDSMRDSVRFAVERTLIPCKRHTCCKSSFVDHEGAPMEWHDFGTLEGPGWAANAVGGAWEIYLYADRMGDARLKGVALSLLDHALDDGFIDYESGFITGYRDTMRDSFCLNFKHSSDWFCPGSMARIAYQLLTFADLLDGSRKERMRRAAAEAAHWIDTHVRPTPNGLYPRRCTPSGEGYPLRAEGGEDPLFEKSGDGLFIIQLMAGLTERGLADHSSAVRRKVGLFMEAGGFFGSINHDTCDEHECVSYAVAFRALLQAAGLLGDRKVRSFAYETCLAGLDQFKLTEDRNGVRTKGLLFMEKSWDTAYLWENAEAAAAYLDAYADTRDEGYREEALVILEAMAKHHHGEHGFLTEGVDWNNHVGAQHHFDGALYGDIRYTEPLLNNLHIVEPTMMLALT